MKSLSELVQEKQARLELARKEKALGQIGNIRLKTISTLTTLAFDMVNSRTRRGAWVYLGLNTYGCHLLSEWQIMLDDLKKEAEADEVEVSFKDRRQVIHGLTLWLKP